MGAGTTACDSLYGEAPPGSGTLYWLQVYKSEGFYKLRYMEW